MYRIPVWAYHAANALLLYVCSLALALALRSSDPYALFFGPILCPLFMCAAAALFAISFKWPLEYRIGTIVLVSVFSNFCFVALLVA